jgi:hypothetical protein
MDRNMTLYKVYDGYIVVLNGLLEGLASLTLKRLSLFF